MRFILFPFFTLLLCKISLPDLCYPLPLLNVRDSNTYRYRYYYIYYYSWFQSPDISPKCSPLICLYLPTYLSTPFSYMFLQSPYCLFACLFLSFLGKDAL